MRSCRTLLVLSTLTALVCTTLVGCESAYIPAVLGGGTGTGTTGASVAFAGGTAFTDNLIQARTFVAGTSVATVTYALNDYDGSDDIDDDDVLHRTPFGIDFNGDGRIDPVIGYGDVQAVIQILLSDPDAAEGEVSYISLTLDSKRDMEDLADVAVGDIDRDGALDIVAAAEGSLWYFHHPSGQPTTALHLWGNTEETDDLRERIDASYSMLTDDELQAIITQAIGPGVNLDDYMVSIEQLYTNVEIGDLDNDGDADIAASRSFIITMTPKPDVPVEPLQIVDGDVLAFINPGFAADGNGWAGISIGGHERQMRLDRDGAAGLLLYDIDDDGDLDVVSAARKDNNAQVAWFENPVQNRPDAPGSALSADVRWTQWRIGSIRDAWAIDVGDLTGDGLPDVVATGPEQMQMLLFEQPSTGPRRAWDWDTYVLATYDAHEPLDVKIVDIDNDGAPELITGGTLGAVRHYENTGDPRDTWDAGVVVTFPAGDVGLLGHGDLDGDGDLDLVVVVAGDDDNDSQVAWIRNETIP